MPNPANFGEMSADRPSRRLILAIATTGRREVVAQTLSRLPLQRRVPDLLVLSIADEADVDRAALADLPFPVQVVTGPKGACNQRNRVVEILAPSDLLVFTDDDFLMASDFLEETEAMFDRHAGVVMVTGTVLADGISNAGISHQEGVDILMDHDREAGPEALRPVYNAYGCNMAMRAAPIVAQSLRFDERLPFYSWLEDVDFSRQLSGHGRIVKSNRLRGVHLGTKMGRSSGRLLGYSQISNPVYLIRKGTMKPNRALRMMFRNILANSVKSLRPEAWVDRRGRLVGNALGFWDLLRGRLDPARVIHFPK